MLPTPGGDFWNVMRVGAPVDNEIEKARKQKAT
jgi:hypothetical protein